MKSVEFCYWLQGMFELDDPKTFNAKQTELIKKHLHMVFKHEIDPSYPDAKKLDRIHGKKVTKTPSPFDGNRLIRC